MAAASHGQFFACKVGNNIDQPLHGSTLLDIDTPLDCKACNRQEECQFYLTPNGIERVDSDGEKVQLQHAEIVSFDCTDDKLFAISKNSEVLTGHIRDRSLHVDRKLPPSKQVACGTNYALLLTIDNKLFRFSCDGAQPYYLDNLPAGRPVLVAAGDNHMVAVLADSKDDASKDGAHADLGYMAVSISSVLFDCKVSDPSARLLAFKRLNFTAPPSPTGIVSVDEAGSLEMQEVITVVHEWRNAGDVSIAELDVPHVVHASCGREHTALTTMFGKLFLTGKPFNSKPSLTKPEEVKCDDTYFLRAEAGEYVTVAMLLRNQQDHGYAFGVVNDDFTFCFCSGPAEPRDLILQGLSCSRGCSTGTVLLREEPHPQKVKNIIGFCKKYNNAIAALGPQIINRSLRYENCERMHKALQLLLQSMVTLVRRLTFHIIPALNKSAGRSELCTLLRNHSCALEEFWLQLLLLDIFKDIRSKIEKADTLVKLKDLKEKAPQMSDLSLLLQQLQGIMENDMLRSIESEVTAAELRVKDLNNYSLTWSNVINDKDVSKFIFRMGERINFSTLENESHRDLSGPVKIHVEPIDWENFKPFLPVQMRQRRSSVHTVRPKLLSLSEKPKVLCLTERHLILYRKGVIFAWDLSAVWIDCNETNSIVIITPELKLTLSPKDRKNENLAKWKDMLEKAIIKTFDNSPFPVKQLQKWDMRTMRYQFQDGPLKDCLYDGEWSLGKFHGKGHFIAEQCDEDSAKVTARSRKKLKHEYEGEFHDGCPSGFGTYAVISTNEPKGTDQPKIMDAKVQSGFWENEKLNGFGTLLVRKCAQDRVLQQSLYYGHFSDGHEFGYGVRFGNEQTSIERVLRSDKGKTTHITTIDHKMKMIDYKLTPEHERRGEYCNNDLWYRGVLNEQNEPAGEGILINHYSTKNATFFEGNVHLRNGEVMVNGRLLRSFEEPRREVADGEVHTQWASLVKDCRLALIAGHSAQADEMEIARYVWKEKLEPLLTREPYNRSNSADWTAECTTSDSEIKEWESVLERRNHSFEKWEKMKTLTRHLLERTNFPLSVLFDVRMKVVEIPAGFKTVEDSKIYQLVRQDFSALISDVYSLIRIFFPILPISLDEQISCDGDILYGRDFCLSILPESIRKCFVAIIFQESKAADSLRCGLRRLASASEIFFLDSLKFKNQQLQDAFKLELEARNSLNDRTHPLDPSQANRRTFQSCVEELQEFIRDKSACLFGEEPVKNFVLLQYCETVNQNFKQFLRSACGVAHIDASDEAEARKYLFWKARRKECEGDVTFLVKYLRFFMKHRASAAQMELLDQMQTAYWHSFKAEE